MFRQDVMRICSLKEYCGPWQFHSAANVLLLWSSLQGIFNLMLGWITTTCFVPVKLTVVKQESLVFCGQVFPQTTETYIIILSPL